MGEKPPHPEKQGKHASCPLATGQYTALWRTRLENVRRRQNQEAHIEKPLRLNPRILLCNYWNEVLVLDKTQSPHTPPDPGKPREKRPEIASQMPILLTPVHNWIQWLRKNGNSWNRNSDNNENCNCFTVLHYSFFFFLITKIKMLSLQIGIRKEKFWQSVRRSKQFMHLWVAVCESRLSVHQPSGRVRGLTFSSHAPCVRSGEAVISESVLGFAFAGAWNRESIPLVIERVWSQEEKAVRRLAWRGGGEGRGNRTN